MRRRRSKARRRGPPRRAGDRLHRRGRDDRRALHRRAGRSSGRPAFRRRRRRMARRCCRRAGRVVVEKDLSAPGLPDVFVDRRYGICDAGGRQAGAGHRAGRQAAGRLCGKGHPGAAGGQASAAALSATGIRAVWRRSARAPAIIDFGRIKLKGGLAWWIWGIAHIYFLIGTRSRFAVAWSWLWIYLSGQHSARLITQKETLQATPTEGNKAA
jgi:NADH dehydrogenase